MKSPGQLAPDFRSCGQSCPAAPDESYFFVIFFFFDFFTPGPPGFSLRNPGPPGFSLRKPAPPGFSLRWAIFMGSVVVALNCGVSVVAVEPAAWAESDQATRPAPARSALRMNDFMIEPRWLKVQKQIPTPQKSQKSSVSRG